MYSNMRKIYKLSACIVLGISLASCADKLDSDKYFKDRMSIEDVFTDETRTERWLDLLRERRRLCEIQNRYL